jgi:hypothetical protein
MAEVALTAIKAHRKLPLTSVIEYFLISLMVATCSSEGRGLDFDVDRASSAVLVLPVTSVHSFRKAPHSLAIVPPIWMSGCRSSAYEIMRADPFKCRREGYLRGSDLSHYCPAHFAHIVVLGGRNSKLRTD